MERIIQPYGQAAPPSPHPQVVNLSPPAPMGQAQGAGRYLRALRRRAWLVALVAVVLGTVGGVAVLRQKPVYRVSAQVQIEAPHFDTILSSLVADQQVDTSQGASAELYPTNKLATLRTKRMVDDVLLDPQLAHSPGAHPDEGQQLIEGLKSHQIPRTNRFEVSLDGPDPARLTLVLNLWLRRFADEASSEVDLKLTGSRKVAESSIKLLDQELKDIEGRITRVMKDSPNLSPDGRNLLQDQRAKVEAMLLQKQMRLGELQREISLGKLYPRELQVGQSRDEAMLEKLLETKDYWESTLLRAKRTVKRHLNDPSVRHPATMLEDTLERIADLQAKIDAKRGGEVAADPSSMLLGQEREEMRRLAKEEQKLLEDIRELAPEHNVYANLLEQRKQKTAALEELREKLVQFNMLKETQNKPVEIVQEATEPTLPFSPNRKFNLALVILLSTACGSMLVLLLEHLDKSVRTPDPVVSTLQLPLLGVVPRIRRSGQLFRGGHIWTPNAPKSSEAEAFRNVRASLMGLQGPTGTRAVTLLVTSAEPAEGKSTTALNLAASCARAGERTLLMDVDLRRPSLGAVFGADTDAPGLVDVLRGDEPWQRCLVRSDMPQLDYLPVGDPDGVPIEVLGTLELRQLLRAVSSHYDRVILDGPPILGLADCRVLGRLVDASILVVRSGAHEIATLNQAKTFLELSKVRLAGVVFNAMSEEIRHWWCQTAAQPTRLATAVNRPASPIDGGARVRSGGVSISTA